METREGCIAELQKEIEGLEKQLETKKHLCKPAMVPGTGGCHQVLGTYEQRQEIEELEKEIERKKNLLYAFETNIVDQHTQVSKWNKNDYLRPEYREGGYFTSQDYYDKCDEFHKILEDHGEDPMKLSRDEYIFLKKQFFRNTYGITWLSEEEQYLPGVKIDVHAERLHEESR